MPPEPFPAGGDAPAARHRPDRRLVLLLLLPLLAVALAGGGVVLGARVARTPATSAQEQGPPADRRPGEEEPGGPGNGPREPGSGLDGRPGGPARLEVNQPYGDRDTTFVVSGRGWEPHTEVTIVLAGGPTLPNRPRADRAGAFHYVIGQDRELFPRGLPLGEHVVAATAGGRRIEVRFRVDP